jgi:hypothetical protein
MGGPASRCIYGGIGRRWHCTFIAIPSTPFYPRNYRLLREHSIAPRRTVSFFVTSAASQTTASDGVRLERLVYFFIRSIQERKATPTYFCYMKILTAYYWRRFGTNILICGGFI